MDEDFKRVQNVIDHFHLIPEREISRGNDRLTDFTVDERFGSGRLRFFSDGNSIVILADVLFHEDLPAPEIVKELIYISYYDIANVYLDADFLEPEKKIPLKRHTIYTNLAFDRGWNSIFQGGKTSKGIIFVFPRRNDISLQAGAHTQVLSFEDLKRLLRSLNSQEQQQELALIYHQLLYFSGFNYAGLLYYKAKMNEVLAILLAQATAENDTKSDAWAKQNLSREAQEELAWLLTWLRENPDSRLSINELAQMAHMSPSKLKYTFKAATGQTIGGFRKKVRIESSEKLLRTTDLEISRIAELTGFHSASHFTNFFKKERGVTPREYRQLDWQTEENTSTEE